MLKRIKRIVLGGVNRLEWHLIYTLMKSRGGRRELLRTYLPLLNRNEVRALMDEIKAEYVKILACEEPTETTSEFDIPPPYAVVPAEMLARIHAVRGFSVPFSLH